MEKIKICSYACCFCQCRHDEFHPLYRLHLHRQSKHGLIQEQVIVQAYMRNGGTGQWCEIDATTARAYASHTDPRLNVSVAIKEIHI